MFVVLAPFEIKPVSVDEFARRDRQQAWNSLEKERDCRLFDVCADPPWQGDIVLYEACGSNNGFDDHLESRHFPEFDHNVKDWVKQN